MSHILSPRDRFWEEHKTWSEPLELHPGTSVGNSWEEKRLLSAGVAER